MPAQVVLWDVAGFVNAAPFVRVPARVFEVAKLVAIAAEVEGLAHFCVMVPLPAPFTGIVLQVGAVGPRVVEDVVATLYFTGHHKVSWGVLEDDLESKPIVGVCFQ